MLAGAVLSVVLLSATAVETPSAVEGVLAQSQALMTRGAYGDVVRLLDPLEHRADVTPLQGARLHVQLSAACSQTGDTGRALHEADLADADARTAGAFDVLARAEGIRGLVSLYRGESDQSVVHFQNSLALARKSGDRDLSALSSARLAVAYQDRGDCTRALDTVNGPLDAPGPLAVAARLQLLTRRGLIEAELHEPDAAKRDIADALELTRQSGDRRSEAQVLIDLARTCERFDTDPAAGIGYASQAVAIAHDIQVPILEIGALNQLGSILPKAGRAADARVVLENALELITRYDIHRDEPYVLKNLGAAYERLGLPDQAKDVLQRAVVRADADNLTRIRWVARLALARLEEKRDPARADRDYQACLAIVEEQQTNVLLEGFRAGALDEKLAEFDPYDDYIRFLLDRGDAAGAFYVAERERARTFLDTLSAHRDTLIQQVPAGYTAAEGKVLERIRKAQTTLRAGGLAESKREELLRDISGEEARLSELRLHLATERPALAHARYPTLWRISDLQSRLLRSDEALLSVFLGSTRSVAWVVTRERLTTIELPPAPEMERATNEAVRELRDPVSHSGRAIAALSRMLSVDTIAAAAGSRAHLLVVPHRVLYDIPFEVFTDGGGHPLVERFAVSYAPSASSLAFLRSLPAPTARPEVQLLAIANPVVVGKMATKTRQIDLAHIDLLTPVPESLDEARAVAHLFGRHARVLEGADATRGALQRSGLATAEILHFATHGLIDELRPDRSALVLTAAPPADDGLLQARDIYHLHLSAQLVTLSACETALGQNVTGEGILGLTRAFFYAGARSVVASLWDVDDASAAKFMRSFYKNLRRGDPVDVALQRTKVDFIRGGGRTAAPFYWAAFVVSGQARIPVEPRNPLPVLPIAIAAVTTVLLTIAARAWMR